MKNWIDSKIEKPENADEVLVFAPDCKVMGSILIGRYYDDTDTWTVYDFRDSKLNETVTHWMPLPEPPEQ